MRYIFQPYNYDLSDPGSIPNLFLQHLYLVGVTMLISLIIAIPLGILVARYRRLYFPVITVSGLLYTIPSIAAFAILIPITGLTLATVIIPLGITHYCRRHSHCNSDNNRDSSTGSTGRTGGTGVSDFPEYCEL